MDLDKGTLQTPNAAQYQEYQRHTIDQFKKAFQDMVATSDAAYVRSDSKTYRGRKNNRGYDKEEIYRIVREGDPVERANLSEYFFTVNGLYKRIILHYATFLTYSWILVPYAKNKYGKGNIKDKKVAASYFEAADFCTNFQIDRKCALFARDILVKGAYYGLLYDTGNSVVIMNLPFDYCRSRFKNAEDVDIVEFNMTFFDTIREDELRKEILDTYPKFIQMGYKKYKYHDGPKWIFLPPEMGIYFCYFEERPFFLDLIPMIDDLSDYMDIDKERNFQALKKILVQQVPIDGMKLVFEPDEAEEMHAAGLDMLQNNHETDVLTTYADVELLDMGGTDDEKTQVEDVQNRIYASAGLSKELFFATTAAGLEYSVNNDMAMMMVLGQQFAHFYTVLLNYKFENKKVKFKLLILPISYYNSADYTSRAKELAAFGYSFLTPILSTGLDQTNLSALKDLENELLDLDEVLKPLQSAYTQSGKIGQTPASAAQPQKTEPMTGKQAQQQAKSESKPKADDTKKEDNNKKESDK